jgi:hypothetical protein
MKATETERPMAVRKVIVMAIAVACASGAQALEFSTEGGWAGSFNTTLAAASSWRAEDPNNQIQQDRGQTYNWKSGEQFSEIYKINSELLLSQGDMGFVLRAKGWYDRNLNKRKVRYGNPANGFNNATLANATLPANTAINTGTAEEIAAENERRAIARSGAPMPLSDAGQPLLSRYDGIALLDAYAYSSFELGSNNLQMRLGRQVINWGEGVFFQGVNVATPVDVKALRQAGTEIKEALLPVESLYGNLGLPGGMSLEGFYQLKWRPSNLNSCDVDIWAIEMMGIGTGGQAAACQLATNPSGANAQAGLLELRNGVPGAADLTAVPVTASTAPKNSGQWGLALRFPIESIDTEVGLYAMNIHSRTPFLSGLVSSGYANLAKMTAKWEYPEDVQIFGISAATTLDGWSVAAELNHTPKQPVMLSGADLLNAGFVPGQGGLNACVAAMPTALPAATRSGICGGLAAVSALPTPGLQVAANTALATGAATAQGAAQIAAGPLGDDWVRAYNASKASGGAPVPYTGYRLKAKTNFQFNALNSLSKAITEAIGAQSGMFITEVLVSKADIDKLDALPSDTSATANLGATSPERFGRAFTFGGAGLGASKCSLVTASTQDNVRWGCANEGYMTPFSWGYRVRVSADYPQIFGTSWQVTPSLFFAHDVDGTSVDNQLLEKRKTVALGLLFDLNKAHKINLNYTYFSNDAKYNITARHDNYSVSYSYTF